MKLFDSVKENKFIYFLIKLNIFLIPLYIIIYTGFEIIQIQYAITYFVDFLLKLSGVNSIASGNVLNVPINNGEFLAIIDWDCAGWKSIIFFIALVTATPASIKNKIYGFFSSILIFMVNIVRIWGILFYISNFGTENYKIIHDVLWSWGMICFSILLWLIWWKMTMVFDTKK